MPKRKAYLRNCPKCGSEQIRASASQNSEDYVTTTVSCLWCGFYVEAEDHFADYGTATMLWNKAE